MVVGCRAGFRLPRKGASINNYCSGWAATLAFACLKARAPPQPGSEHTQGGCLAFPEDNSHHTHNRRPGGLAAQSRVRVEARPRVCLALLYALATSDKWTANREPSSASTQGCAHSDSERVVRCGLLTSLRPAWGRLRPAERSCCMKHSNPARSQALHVSPAHNAGEDEATRLLLSILPHTCGGRPEDVWCSVDVSSSGYFEGASASASPVRAVRARRADC